MKSRCAYGFAEFGRVNARGVVVEIGFVEFESGIIDGVSVHCRKKTIVRSTNVSSHSNDEFKVCLLLLLLDLDIVQRYKWDPKVIEYEIVKLSNTR